MEKANNFITASPSRRNFIKSSAAALAVASVSTVALAKAGMDHPDRALFEAIAEWRGGLEEQERLWDISVQLGDLESETEP
ncbi:MAG TPA: twin-arginine translocation signal domain-containing protein [Aestuariivirga sp.]|nr:twin-arginine translocation signal domain-containing protein [Aestuariivirga sp.]